MHRKFWINRKNIKLVVKAKNYFQTFFLKSNIFTTKKKKTYIFFTIFLLEKVVKKKIGYF